MSNIGTALLRVTFGLGLASHGYQAVVVGGVDAINDFASFLEHLGYPAPVVCAWTAKLTELIGGVFVAIGILTRPCAFLCSITMLMAILTAHFGDPFEKWELALLYFSVFTFIVIAGPGKFSIDARRGLS
ncbi:MAG: DoxX family protein [Planctomycetota bacterium]|jgi:putative oxidoreductase|nr:DoxX family protein [Planctomycetota bacterium]